MDCKMQLEKKGNGTGLFCVEEMFCPALSTCATQEMGRIIQRKAFWREKNSIKIFFVH